MSNPVEGYGRVRRRVRRLYNFSATRGKNIVHRLIDETAVGCSEYRLARRSCRDRKSRGLYRTGAVMVTPSMTQNGKKVYFYNKNKQNYNIHLIFMFIFAT